MAQASLTVACILPETIDMTVTSFLPVVTPWPVPTNCSDVDGWILEGHPTFSSVSCHPDVFWSWWEAGKGQIAKTMWSLGPFECPELYTTAALTQVAAEQVEVVCCPS
jgi:hypothetical protein